MSSWTFQNDISTGTSMGFNEACELTFALRKGRPTGDHLDHHLDCAKKQGSCWGEHVETLIGCCLFASCLGPSLVGPQERR